VTDPIHDFTAKLRQPSLRTRVESYVRWRKALARARAAGREEPPPPDWAPLSINLDLTTACNYRCDHCIDWDILNSKHRHDERRLRDSLRTLAQRGLRSVILIGGGEPTLYPGFCELVRFLKRLGLHVAVVSNGGRGDLLLAIADDLDEHDWVRLSLDAGSDELFRAMHRPVSRSLTLDEICEWVPRIKRRSPRIRVGYSYIIVWRGAARGDVALHENVHEIAMATERARRYGFDYISLKPVLERAAEGAEIMDAGRSGEGTEGVVARIRREVERARQLETDSFRVHVSTNLRALEDGSWREYTNQPATCHMQALRQVLTPLGLYNCPAHRGVDKARIAGADAFAGEAEAERTGASLARLVERFDASRECREVTCLYNGANWWLEKMIQDPRDDVEIEPGDERLDFFL
jgi:wyosine [tRNA(Phe)-imidazoG37] synthetase (radical SAM superfamily)